MKILHSLVLVIGLLLSTTNMAEPITLYTGFQKGTYNVAGGDLQKACSPKLDITVEPGGSLTNLNALINTPVYKSGNRFALVQREVYDMVIGPVPKPKPVKRVMPLFQEEITILVNKSKQIKDLRDLAGRRVAAGAAGSGIWVTSALISTTLDLKWLSIERTPEESILLLLTGDIDAMVVVGSHPLRLFRELPSTFSNYVEILDLSGHSKLDSIYPTDAVIPANTYIWQQTPIKTKSTTTYLLAAEDVPPKVIKEFKSCIQTNLPMLKKMGHPKWQTLK